MLFVSAPAFAAAADPPGNNGTVKIDGAPWDDSPDNEPHPGCAFEVDFYGFDQGDLWADVTFEGIAPTGGGTLLTDRVFIGEDSNAGGGSEAGLDASKRYDLTAALASVAPQRNQGWHVKLTVEADGSQGADTKHKVFWVGPCGDVSPATTVPPTTVPLPTTTATTTATTVGTTTTTEAPTTTLAAGLVLSESTTATTATAATEEGATVLGEHITRASSAGTEVAGTQVARPQSSRPNRLATTGAALGALTVLGAALVTTGRWLHRRAAALRA